MRQEIKNGEINWINITNPQKNDVEFLKSDFNICPSILKEYIPNIKRPKVEEYKNYLFVVIHFPVFDRKERKTISAELDIILFENVLITSHNGLLPELKKVFEKCKTDETAKNYYIKNSAIELVFRILDKLIDTRLPMLDHIDDHISDIEEQIFRGNERKMVNEIAIVKHDIISFRRIIKPQRMVLESLSRKVLKISDENLLNIVRRNELNVIGKISNQAHHYTIQFGKENRLFIMDLRTKEHRTISLDCSKYSLAICDSGEKIIEPQKICAERIEECEVGVKGLRLYVWGIKNLRDIELEFLLKHVHMLPGRIFSRVLYNVKERLRAQA
ncbi:hypothetical protein KKD57_00730, partial [Patescibacteria group bacterium]|nr:hypothetical protein [Patescibacteria group bacterium]